MDVTCWSEWSERDQKPEELGLRQDRKSVPSSHCRYGVATDLPWEDHFSWGQDWCLLSSAKLPLLVAAAQSHWHGGRRPGTACLQRGTALSSARVAGGHEPSRSPAATAALCDIGSLQPRLIRNRLVQIKFKLHAQFPATGNSGSVATEVPAEKVGKCQCETHHAKSILYQILNKEHGSETKWHQQYRSPHRSTGSKGCSCMDRRRAALKTPEATCRRASEVLLKTFIGNLPSFYHVPWEDQLVLVQQNWAPLFVLGIAQEGVDFDLREISAPSLLKKILLNQSLTASNELGSASLEASLAEVQKMKNLLWKFWDLNISAKEYAYLKGIILFNSGCHVLKCLPYVQTLQQEAQQTLMEFISTMFHRNLGWFAWILQLIASLRDIDADAIEELFFRPILGEAPLNVLLLETLCIKPHWL
ncbi:PREDICTED: nuclear receptor subfamily 0 group B member 2-like [Fulmarus glacialis]|uniref:nuclear receptor subfamily 0 group B member 2-like n=1 Tax=Fulmarus glacialis TaxID=30455 RepID=UPI00051C3D73|nr:PREDICTED: nuclear receptor subfamily 0 group B member 2-like [Fulmarus glacialis]